MYNNFATCVFYKDQLDLTFADPDRDLIIIDKAVYDIFSTHFIRNSKSWKYIYSVDGGESLKDWTVASEHINKLCSLWGIQARRSDRVIVCGGGSVGDFGGFFASIIKRGVLLTHIPTTWLAAVDSAHGGKTALNVQGVKNQLGSFYPANEVYIFKNILWNQSVDRVVDGFGECLKMLLLDKAQVPEEKSARYTDDFRNDLQSFLWTHLETCVQKKYTIVLADPYETVGLRKLLNLGHTFGHILESATRKSHGLCVLQGIIFSILWSVERGQLDDQDRLKIFDFIKTKNIPIWHQSQLQLKMVSSDLKKLLTADKKIVGDEKLDFVFLKTYQGAFVQSVTVNEIVAEAHRQGWVS